jgi:AraC family transcriptional regulator of adaptative response/methylated-DNA-[protein]-cysteine methyltransferase
MDTQDNINYKRIAEAITFIKNNFKRQPSLEEIAAFVNLSPAHFQRLFTMGGHESEEVSSIH